MYFSCYFSTWAHHHSVTDAMHSGVEDDYELQLRLKHRGKDEKL